jgi:hypothetical protein
MSKIERAGISNPASFLNPLDGKASKSASLTSGAPGATNAVAPNPTAGLSQSEVFAARTGGVLTAQVRFPDLGRIGGDALRAAQRAWDGVSSSVNSTRQRFDSLSDAEKRFLSTNLHLAGGFSNAADTADALTSARFNGRSVRNEDEVNAVRHAMWNALMVKRAFDNPVTQTANVLGNRLGEAVGKAREFGNAHEDNPKNTVAVSRNMDLHNNEVGRQVAERVLRQNPNASDEDLANAIMDAYRQGRLVERSGNNLVTAQ